MADLVHCKGSGHVSIAGSPIPPVGRTPKLTATWVPGFTCSQTPGELTDVIVVGPAGHPGRGMHLLREVWPFVVGNLRAMASSYPEGAVDIRHTVRGQWETAWEIHSADARVLADLISTIAGEHQ